MKFFLRYKGKIKEHISDSSGVRSGIIAEGGECIEVLVSGSKNHQKIGKILVSKDLENTTVSIPLKVHLVKLRISDSKGELKNNTFYVKYRGREIEKITDDNGIIQLRMLNAFVYKLLLKDKKEVLTLRNDQSVSIVNVKLNDIAASVQQRALLHKPICKSFFSDIIFK